MLGTRAVIRPTEAGHSAICTGCRSAVKFVAKRRGRHVIANVYVDDKEKALPAGVGGGTWRRVEHWHAFCYEEAGEPHGTPMAGDWQPEVRNERRHRAVAS